MWTQQHNLEQSSGLQSTGRICLRAVSREDAHLFLCFPKGEFSNSPGREGSVAETGGAGGMGWGHYSGPAAQPAPAQALCNSGLRCQDPRFCRHLFQPHFCLALFSISFSATCSPQVSSVGWGELLMARTRRLCTTWCIIHLGICLFPHLKPSVAGLSLLFIFTVILTGYRQCLFSFPCCKCNC